MPSSNKNKKKRKNSVEERKEFNEAKNPNVKLTIIREPCSKEALSLRWKALL